MLFYGFTHILWESVPEHIAPILYIVLIIVSALCVKLIPINSRYLWMFGWMYTDFYSADYYPVFPWLFFFLLGTWIGRYIREGRLPSWFYEARLPYFSYIGRHALIIYIVHQPVLRGIAMLISHL